MLYYMLSFEFLIPNESFIYCDGIYRKKRNKSRVDSKIRVWQESHTLIFCIVYPTP